MKRMILLITITANLVLFHCYKSSAQGFNRAYIDDDLTVSEFFIGLGSQIYSYNSDSNGVAFSFGFGADYGSFGGFIDVNINECVLMDYNSPNYMNLVNCNLWDFKLEGHYYPFKMRTFINPYIMAGLGYSKLVRTGETYVSYNYPIYNLVDRRTLKRNFMAQAGVGLSIILFKGFLLNVEYSKSFFRKPSYLNGDQIIYRIGTAVSID